MNRKSNHGKSTVISVKHFTTNTLYIQFSQFSRSFKAAKATKFWINLRYQLFWSYCCLGTDVFNKKKIMISFSALWLSWQQSHVKVKAEQKPCKGESKTETLSLTGNILKECVWESGQLWPKTTCPKTTSLSKKSDQDNSPNTVRHVASCYKSTRPKLWYLVPDLSY